MQEQQKAKFSSADIRTMLAYYNYQNFKIPKNRTNNNIVTATSRLMDTNIFIDSYAFPSESVIEEQEVLAP